MAKLTCTERLGLAKKVAELLLKQAGDLKKAGLDPDEMRKRLQEAIEDNVASNEKRESMKAALKDQTKVVNEKDRTMCVTTSSYIDVLSGAPMKNSASSQVLRRLRSKARMEPRPRTAEQR